MTAGRTPTDEDLELVRHQLLALVQRPQSRSSEFTRERPTVWRPTEVISPETGMPFTSVGAWHFIAESLEAGQKIEVIVLDQPAGKTGYVMKVPLASRIVYIKLELGSGKVIGRSFHYSEEG